MMSSLLQWEEIYCFQKFLPLLTRWQLFHYVSRSQNIPISGNVWPDFIKKKRAPKGVASYEIVWKDEQRCFDGLVPTSQLEAYLSLKGCGDDEAALQSLWSTIEPIDLVEKAYPDLVEKFLQSKVKPKRTKTNARKPAKRTQKIADNSLNDMSLLQQAIDEIDGATSKVKPKASKQTKRKSPKAKKAKMNANSLQTLDKFFQQNQPVKSKDSPVTTDTDVGSPSPTPFMPTKTINLSDFSVELDEGDDGDCNLSQIISDIVSKSPKVTEIGGRRLRFDKIKIQRGQCPPSADEIDFDVDVELNNENVLLSAEESFDEFDLLVMGKGTKCVQKKLLSESNEHMKSSTPILVNRFLNKIGNQRRASSSDSRTSADAACSTDVIAKNVITASFFSLATDDDIDLFEKSIDYKNMEDVDLNSSDSASDDDVDAS